MAAAGIVNARWTNQILDECFAAILRQRPDLRLEALARTRALMIQAIPDCIVEDYQVLINEIVLPDPDDRHVLAAAITCRARCIVTMNLRDFPPHVLEKYAIRARHPDDIICDAIRTHPETMMKTVIEQAAALTHPEITLSQLLDTLETCGLSASAKLFRQLTS